MRSFLPLLIGLILLPLAASLACFPTGGMIGSTYPKRLNLEVIYNKLKEMGLKVTISEDSIDGIKLKRIEVKLADLTDFRVLHGYIYAGRKTTLVMAETDVSLSNSSLLLMEFLLSAASLTNPENFSKPVVSHDNQVPPTALVKWLKDDMKVEVKQEILRCSSKGVNIIPSSRREVAVLSNDVDKNMSLDVISKALMKVGLRAVWLNASDPEEAAKLIKYPAAIILGGHRSLRSGYASRIFMPMSAIRKLELWLRKGEKKSIIHMLKLPGGSLLFIIAGVDRYETRKAAEQFASSDGPSLIKETISSLPVEKGRSIFEVKIKETESSCLSGNASRYEVGVGYNTILILYGEQVPNPCFRHKIEWWELDKDKKVLRIVLGLKEPDKVCIQCLGYIKTKILVGPLPEGEWTIIVNGREKKVRI